MPKRKPRDRRNPRPIAFCLAGFSPAVVTETLYALAIQRRPRIIAQRVCILTTQDAYAPVVSALLGKGGAIRRLVSEYRLPANALICTPDDVVILRSRSGRPLPDIRSSSDSREGKADPKPVPAPRRKEDCDQVLILPRSDYSWPVPAPRRKEDCD